MSYKRTIVCCGALTALVMAAAGASAREKPFSFGVISQRSPIMSAQYWNPILRYVTERSGVPLELKLAKTGPDHAAAVLRGEYDFIYSNHNFRPTGEKIGYRVFARPMESAIRGQVIVMADSPIKTVADLQGKEVVFPSNVAFVGYVVPMNMLIETSINVKPLFAGNQEGAIGQLVTGRAIAAGVNSEVAQAYASRQNVSFRVLWSSEEYLNIPLSVHPAVPKEKFMSVRDALVNMAKDPEGSKVLAASAELIQQKPPYGFVVANDNEFDNQRKLYLSSRVESVSP